VLPALADALGPVPFVLLAPALAFATLALYMGLTLASAVLVKRLLMGRYRPTREPVWSEHYIRHWLVQQAVKRVPWWLLEGTELMNAALRALGARVGQRVHIHHGVDLLRGGYDLLEIGDDVTLCRDAALGLVALDNGHIVTSRVTLGAGATLDIHSHVGGDAVVEAGGFLTARSSLPPGGRIPRGERWDGIPARPAGLAPEAPALPPGAVSLGPWRIGILMIVARFALLWLLAVPAQLCAIALLVGSGLDETALLRWLATPSLSAGLLLGCVAALTLPVPLTLALEALACRLMGRAEAGVISRWSPGYVRLSMKAWLLDLGSQWLYGTLFWPAFLRLAGMRVGKGCEISSLYDSVPEQIEIGEKTFCADGIYLGGPTLHRSTVSVAPLRLGRNNFVGNGAVLAGGLQLPDDVLLGVCTVAEGADIRPGTSWFGHPPLELPRRQIVELDPGLTHSPSPLRYGIRIFWETLRFVLPVVLAAILPVWYRLLAGARAALPGPAFLLVAVPALSFGGFALAASAIVLLKWAFVGRVRPGMHPLWSSWASRWDFICLAWSLYMERVVSALDGTPYLPWLLRAVGVRIGRGVVIGAGFAGDLPDPDMLTFEDGATVDCMFQAHTFEDRVLKMDRVTVRQGATLGRNAVLLYGAEAGAGACVAPNSVVMKHEHLLPGLRYEGFPTQATGSA
jgi:non-ribosomal peptide synthetase-like protein